MLRAFLYKVAVVFLVHGSLSQGKDLLHLFRPQADLPQELNEFLTNVQQHRKDFAYIRKVAKNQKNYESSFKENNDLIADDIQNQLTMNTEYPDLKSQEIGSRRQRNSFRSYYPEERYSKYLHSPVRLKRRLVQSSSAGDFGNIQRAEPKFPKLHEEEEENRYHTGYIVGVQDDDEEEEEEEEEYPEIHPPGKIKRDVEISIKSDGELIKHIEQNENGPKSIVLNIKPKMSEEVTWSTASRVKAMTEAEQEGKTTPSVGNQNQIVGVPINSIPAEVPNNGLLHQVKYQDQEESRPYYRPDSGYGDFKFDNSHMAKSIDMAQNNANTFDGSKEKQPVYSPIGEDFNLNNNKNEFEKVEGVVIDNNKPKATYKRRVKKYEDSNYKIDGGYDYLEPLGQEAINWPQFEDKQPQSDPMEEVEDEKIKLDSHHPTEVIEKSTKEILVIPLTTTTTTSECKSEEDDELEKEGKLIGEAIAEEIRKEEEKPKSKCVPTPKCQDSSEEPPEEEVFEIVKHPHHHEDHHNNTDIEIIHHSPEETQKHKREVTRRPKRHKKKKTKKKKKTRKRKHLAAKPKYKRKHSRQHPKKIIERDLTDQPDFYDMNQFYDAPQADFIPSFRGRRLKSSDEDSESQDEKKSEKLKAQSERDPLLLPDRRRNVEKALPAGKKGAMAENVRKKFKSEEDYTDEEDPISGSPPWKFPVKKSKNKFSFDTQTAKEDDDDDYNYEDLTSMDDEDEDIAFEEEEATEDNLEVDEAVGNRSEERETDRFSSSCPPNPPTFEGDQPSAFNTQKSTKSSFFISAAPDYDLEDVMDEANELLSIAHGHGKHKKKKKKKNKTNPKQELTNTKSAEQEEQKLNPLRRKRGENNGRSVQKDVDVSEDMVSNLHGRGPHPFKSKKQKMKLKREIEEKHLSNEQKQDLFLRYNPEFQRWPRFVQSDNEYQKTMRKRASKNRRRFFHNSKENPVKRQESCTPDASTSSLSTSGEVPTSTPKASEASLGIITGGSLPAAAENILRTANSAIFDSTFDMGEGFGNTSVKASTPFVFTTNEDDLTSNTQCDVSHDPVFKPCLDESASHSPVSLTSVLPLISESVAQPKINLTKDEYLDLSEILSGTLPRQIVSDSLSEARGSVRKGLRVGRYNTNLMVSEYNGTAESALILDEMASLMTKLKYLTSCQTLMPNLRSYLKAITRNEMDDPMTRLKELNEIDFDTHQSNYVFRGGQIDNVQEKAEILKGLLDKYNNLPENCKERAEPVKEYIESHLSMIDHVGGKKGSKLDLETTTPEPPPQEAANTEQHKVKKEINIAEEKEQNLENQMVEEGLRNQKPDANEVIEDQNKKSKREEEQFLFAEMSTSTSHEYGKLADAVRNARNRRQILERIGEIYGGSKGSGKVEEDRPKREEKGFEAPQVINF